MPKKTAVKYFTKGQDKLEKNEYQAAIVYFTQAIKEDQTFFDAYECLSKFYYDADNFKACIDCCNKLLLNANYQTFNLYYRRGLAHFELGNYKATIDDLTNAIKMAISSGANHPQLADGYNRL